VRTILPDVISGTAAITPKPTDGIGPCPQCKVGVVRPTPKGAGCHRWKEGCTFTIWKEQRGKSLSDGQIKDLIEKGQTKVIKGFKKKDGSGTYDARLIVNDEFKVVLEGSLSIAPGSENGLGTCPQCQQGTVRQTPKGAGCSRWKEGCTLSIWREQYGKALSDDEIKELVSQRCTQIIKGFKKKDGSGSYDARLILNAEFKVRLEFGQTSQVSPPTQTEQASQTTQPGQASQTTQPDQVGQTVQSGPAAAVIETN
jgi:DNA topoisomerase III